MKKFIFSVAAITLLILSSCTKEELVSENKDEMLKQDSFIEVTSASTDAILAEILKMNASYPATKAFWGEKYLTGTVTITIRDSSGVRIFLVDFGTAGNLFNGWVGRTITRDIDANTQQAVITEDFKVTIPDGTKFTKRVSSLNRLIKGGVATTKDDDTIETYGTTTITNEKNETRTRTIEATTPLIFKVSASEIVKGIAKTTFADG